MKDISLFLTESFAVQLNSNKLMIVLNLADVTSTEKTLRVYFYDTDNDHLDQT